MIWQENTKKKSTWNTRHRWKANVNVDRKELEQEVMDWINISQDRGQWHAIVKRVIRFCVS
jgi:hypothetical protein